MSEVNISRNEILFLKEELKKRVLKDFSDLIYSDIAWNSSPKSYILLCEEINICVTQGKGLSTTFLRDFLYYDDASKTVRKGNIDRIYNYLYGTDMDREVYLLTTNTYFSDNKYVVYHHASMEDVEKETFSKNDLEAYDFRNIFDSTKEDVITGVESRSEKTYIYISEKFLKDLSGMAILADLFENRFISLVVDYNIELVFDENILNEKTAFNIVTIAGVLKYLTYWKDLSVTPEYELLCEYDEVTSELFTFLTSNKVLLLLRNIRKIKDLRGNLSEGTFLPVLKDVLRTVNPDPINEIFENEDITNKGENYSFLAVCNQATYVDKNNQKDLIHYFREFSAALNNAHITRIFTVPGKRVRGGGWEDSMTKNSREVLHDYAQLNMSLGVNTFILYYDEDYDEADRKILWNQDYVIRYKNDSDNIFNIQSVQDDNNSAELYFTYPMVTDGKKQMLKVTETFYVDRMFKDFKNRLAFFEDQNACAELIDYKNIGRKIRKLKSHKGNRKTPEKAIRNPELV